MEPDKKDIKIRKVAPLKQTSGEGYEIENSIGAYFISFLLSTRIFNQTLGQIIRIDFQTSVDDFLLDDILITCTLNNKIQKCLISAKSNRQFSKNKAPKDFVYAAWKNYLHEVDSKFDKKSDFFCLIITHLNPDLSKNLNILLKMASDQNSDDLSRRLKKTGYVSEDIRQLFNSFECPIELASKYGISINEIGNFLKCVKVFEFDFERDQSEKVISGLRNCQDILLNHSPNDASSLWNELEEITRLKRKAGGYIDLEELVDKLRLKFSLTDYPFHQNDWAKLLKFSKEFWQSIPSKIGDKITLPREGVLHKLEHSNSRITIFTGESGSGKTTLVKLLADSKEELKNKILWWDGTWLNQEDLPTFERKLGLVYPLSELFDTTPDISNLVIIDGIDRIYSETGFQRLSQLIHSLKLYKRESPWHVIITCQSEEWMRLQDSLQRHNILNKNENPFTIICLEDLTDGEVNQILDKYPNLKKLRGNISIRPLLKKPKILDLLARHSGETKNWTGESDFIRWFWETEVEKGHNPIQRSTVLQKFSEQLADKWESDASEMDFDVSDLPIIEELLRDRLCKRFQSRISFSHDLYGDWARQRIIVNKTKNVASFIKEKCYSPVWHRGIQLFGLHLIEQNDDPTQWSEMIHSLGDGSDSHFLAQDLILESVIFAADPLPLLEKIWPELSKDDGKLLKSLLFRFQYLATIANPRVQEKAKEVGVDLTEAALIERVPYWPYWIPMIKFLSHHQDEVICLDPKSIAAIGKIWLSQTPEKWPLRNEVANLVLRLAEDIRLKQKNDKYSHSADGFIKSVYFAAIHSITEQPDRVAKLILDICERSVSGEQYHTTHKKVVHSQIDGDLEYPPPWCNGPNERIDSDFIEICINESALYPLIRSNPKLAREVCLAIIIESPRPRSINTDTSFWDDELGLNSSVKIFPALFDKGPFLRFLEINPEEGLDLIIQLVNFATERWGDIHTREHGITTIVRLLLPEKSVTWIGNNDVYTWHLGLVTPNLLGSSLMALEKFFYDKIDKNEPIDKFIEIILNKSKSVAFGGLLISLGKYRPNLFLGPLKPMFAVSEFLGWELSAVPINPSYCIGPNWIPQSSQRKKIAFEWYAMPHRNNSIRAISNSVFLNSKDNRIFFDGLKINWENEVIKMDNDNSKRELLNILISWFDISNYTEVEKDGIIGYEYNPPQNILNDFKKNEEKFHDSQINLQVMNFIFQCNEVIKDRSKNHEFDPDTIWKNLTILFSDQNFIDRSNGSTRQDAICAGCAVLLLLFPEYLKKNSDRKNWCKERILDTLRNPPQYQSLYDNEDNIVDFRWDSFCAWVLPNIWAESPESQEIRKFVLKLAINFHYITVEILFTSCGNYREKLGDNFSQLEHFILLWSAAKNKWTFSKIERTAFDVEAWLDKNAPTFIKGSLAPELPRLNEIENKSNKTKFRFPVYNPKSRLKLPGFDLKLIQVAFKWQYSINLTLNSKERDDWINFTNEILELTINQFGEMDVKDKEYDGHPSEWDEWVLSRVAYYTAELKLKDNANALWHPILNLGTECHEWINKFLFCWGMNLHHFKENPENFIREWKSMIDFAISSPKWSFESSNNITNLEDIWCCLLSISSITWDLEQKDIVNKMLKTYQNCAPIILARRKIAEKFIAFLSTPAADDIRLESLVWIYSASDKVGIKYWSNSEINKKMAILLNLCWKDQSQKFSENPEAFDAFKKLLKILADRQIMLAYAIFENASKTKFSL